MAVPRRFRSVIVLLGVLAITAVLALFALGQPPSLQQDSDKIISHGSSSATTTEKDSKSSSVPSPKTGNDLEDDNSALSVPDRGDYREIFSLTTVDRKFFPIYFSGDEAYNPNIIPHPTRYDMWIVVAQHEQSKEQIDISGELVCEAGFLNGVLVCASAPTILPIAPSITGVCEGDLAYMNFRFGPGDARMFNGSSGPLILYGSQSQYACLGIWVQDVRMLLDSFRLERFALSKLFTSATEIRRPPPFKGIEKNFFIFWDLKGKAYAHYDVYPKRAFAELDFNGAVGEDLALKTAADDEACMAQYMPSVGPDHESIHQATNSLSITMCRRADPKCKPTDTNTFIITFSSTKLILQNKSYYTFHGIYEPYIILLQSRPPFAIYGISQRPLWIHGRNALSPETHSLQYEGRPASDIPEGHTEMFYVTSISWKGHDQKYHGYVDDVLLLAFGIEDARSGGIDVKAGDLLQDIAFCSSL
ncbi:hypothetical protein LTR62_002183 [Meristemomyces frigidus]|uniref:Uncharacterized protein n=1 Tax=Meristemomyces frigidus TaxID=1508187 RepID=A0AAN7T7D5_9PEZI|nr:hypothetical protein LTR62_002183 [Meristemomyces frigidus]